jgi:hypothetical protein
MRKTNLRAAVWFEWDTTCTLPFSNGFPVGTTTCFFGAKVQKRGLVGEDGFYLLVLALYNM